MRMIDHDQHGELREVEIPIGGAFVGHSAHTVQFSAEEIRELAVSLLSPMASKVKKEEALLWLEQLATKMVPREPILGCGTIEGLDTSMFKVKDILVVDDMKPGCLKVLGTCARCGRPMPGFEPIVSEGQAKITEKHYTMYPKRCCQKCGKLHQRCTCKPKESLPTVCDRSYCEVTP